MATQTGIDSTVAVMDWKTGKCGLTHPSARHVHGAKMTVFTYLSASVTYRRALHATSRRVAAAVARREGARTGAVAGCPSRAARCERQAGTDIASASVLDASRRTVASGLAL